MTTLDPDPRIRYPAFRAALLFASGVGREVRSLFQVLALVLCIGPVLGAEAPVKTTPVLTEEGVWKIQRILEELSFPAKTAALKERVVRTVGTMDWTGGSIGGGRGFSLFFLGNADCGYFSLELEHPLVRREGRTVDIPDEGTFIRARLVFHSPVGGYMHVPAHSDSFADFPKPHVGDDQGSAAKLAEEKKSSVPTSGQTPAAPRN